MWDSTDSDIKIDGLKKLMLDIEDEAYICDFEIRLLGGLLKFTPKNVYTKVFLEIEQSSAFQVDFIIYKHRTYELTKKYKGRQISKEWVLKFLENNAVEAGELVEENKNNPPKIRKPNYITGYEKIKVCWKCGSDSCTCFRSS